MTEAAEKIRNMNNQFRAQRKEATVVNEQEKSKIKIDEKNIGEKAKETTVNENLETQKTTINQIDPFAPEVTNVNEIPEEEKDKENTGHGNKDKAKEIGTSEDEVYWKEADIIDTMWKDWFIAFFNYATNKAVHAVEYGFAAAYNAYQNRHKSPQGAATTPDAPKKELNNTEKLRNEVVRNLNKSTENNVDNIVKNQKEITDKLKEGKTDEISQQYPAMSRLFATFPQVKAQIEAGKENSPELALALSKNIELFANSYADTKVMTDQMTDQNRYKDIANTPDAVATVFNKEKENGYKILFVEIQNRMTNEGMSVDEAFNAIQKDMHNSADIAHKNFKEGNYSENGKTPKENPYLDHLTGLLANDNDNRSNTEERTQPQTQNEENRAKEEVKKETREEEKKPEKETSAEKEETSAAKETKSVKSEEETLDEIIRSDKYTEEEKEQALDKAIEEEKRRNGSDKDKPKTMAEEAQTLDNSPLQKKYDFFAFQEQQLEGRAYDYSSRKENLQQFKQRLLNFGEQENTAANQNLVEKPRETQPEKATSGAPFSLDYLRGKKLSR